VLIRQIWPKWANVELEEWQKHAMLFAVAGVAVFAPIIYLFYWPAGGMLDVTGHPIGRDFINVWVGPQVAANEGLSALFDRRGYADLLGKYFGTPLPFHNWGYPLFVLPFYWPFAQLPYALALTLWTVLFGVAFLWAATSPIERSRLLLATILIALSPASIINTVGGQNGFLTAALLLGSLLILDRRPTLAGVLIGLLIFKPQLGICLPFVLIALGAWRTIVAAALTAAFLLLYTLPFIGLEPWIEYAEKVGPYQALLLERFQGFYTTMMISVTAGLRSLGVAYHAAITIQLCVSLAVLIATVLAVRQTNNPVLRAFVVVMAVPLISPYGFNYDLTASAAAIVWLIMGPFSIPAAYRVVLLSAWLVPALAMTGSLPGAPQLLLIATFLIGLKLVWNEASEHAQPQVMRRAPEGSTLVS